MKKYTTIFFDLDDTLWDTVSNSKESLFEIYTSYGIDAFFDDFESFYNIYLPCNTALWAKYGQGLISKEQLIVQRFTIPFEGYDVPFDPLEINRDFLERTASKSKIIDHAIEVLDYLSTNYKDRMHILSNGFTEVQYKKLANSKLTNYFDQIILSDQVGVNKPHPSIFDYALQKTNADRATSIMIGDSWASDITGARNSHIDQVWFNPDADIVHDFEATFTISSLLELKNIL